ncbi:MAG: phosphate ABC transporter substrate-binding/OmpA family protein [Hyphomicrobiaceae bacterium]|nr:phosphate ABC transporter substrate-binding/OmpA family protein [Hyphomicrobiaceae bacterium]
MFLRLNVLGLSRANLADQPAARVALLGALLTLSPVIAVAQDALIEVQIDRSQTIAAQRVATAERGMVEIELPQAPGKPLRLPLERVTCVSANCPTELAQLAQAATLGRLPKSADGFQIHGSNTVGAELMPKIVQEFLKSRQAETQIQTEDVKDKDKDGKPREGKRHTIEFDADGGKRTILIEAFGSSTGYRALKDKTAQIWMSSRPAVDKEISELKGQNIDLQGIDSEHVVALDGLAVIVNKAMPIGALSIDEVTDIFSGKITDWRDVKDSGKTGPIKVYRRDDNSGTAATFKDMVLGKQSWSPKAVEFGDSTKLEQEVVNDVAAIGFIGLGYVQNTKPLAIKTKCGMAYKPDPFLIKTEEYPFSRRLFLYTMGQPSNELARQLVDFAGSAEGQKAVQDVRFVDLAMDASGRDFDAQGGRLANMLVAGGKDTEATRKFIDEVRFAKRISTTLRFKPNSTSPDNKALDDIEQLADAMKKKLFGGSRDFLLIGFADDSEEKDGRAMDLSQERATNVATELQKRLDAHPDKSEEIKVYKGNVKWFGAAAPAVCNDEKGRQLNRRVEVWIK